MERLKVMFFGYGGSSWMAEKLRYLIEDKLGMQLITIHEHPNADIPWDLNTVYQELKKADIIIVPANYRRQPCKSNNRVTQAMALGKPVVCDPLPAYCKIIKQGVNGFITAGDAEEHWEKYLKKLRDEPELRKKMGQEALKTAQNYTKEKMSEKWLEALKTLEIENKNVEVKQENKVILPNKSKAVDVIVPTKNNPEILEECLKSFNNSTMEEEVYIIDNGDGEKVEEIAKKQGVPVEVRRY